MLRASLRGRRARREVGRVEGAKIEEKKRAERAEKVQVRCHVDQSDDFSTKVSKQLKVDVAPNFRQLKVDVAPKFERKLALVSVNLS